MFIFIFRLLDTGFSQQEEQKEAKKNRLRERTNTCNPVFYTTAIKLSGVFVTITVGVDVGERKVVERKLNLKRKFWKVKAFQASGDCPTSFVAAGIEKLPLKNIECSRALSQLVAKCDDINAKDNSLQT
jgi:hypothetical protein